jgi:hypothetical protein
MKRQNELQPTNIIPNFYRIPGKAPSEFWNLDIDHQRKMLKKLLEGIEIKNIQILDMLNHYTAEVKRKEIVFRWLWPAAERAASAIDTEGTDTNASCVLDSVWAGAGKDM